jgi:hypothetical protein
MWTRLVAPGLGIKPNGDLLICFAERGFTSAVSQRRGQRIGGIATAVQDRLWPSTHLPPDCVAASVVLFEAICAPSATIEKLFVERSSMHS